MHEFSIRRCRHGDEALILQLLRELAEYEELMEKFHISEDVIRRDYLCEEPPVHCDLAFAGDEAVGIASWYWIYSSFAAKRAIYLEDLFVRPAARGNGYGKSLLAHLAKSALAAGGIGVDWSVLDWNKPSIDFYESIGAKRVTGWFVYRLQDEALRKMANG
jgi:GNAT superfamily N-acetyltransferase